MKHRLKEHLNFMFSCLHEIIMFNNDLHLTYLQFSLWALFFFPPRLKYDIKTGP